MSLFTTRGPFTQTVARKNSRIEKLEDKVPELSLELQKLQHEHSKLHEDLRVAHVGAMRSLEKDRPVAMEDRDVRDKLSTLEEGLRSLLPSLNKKPPFLLTQAVLAKVVLCGIVEDPFFIFPGSPHFENTPRNEHEAHVWRSQMLRILSKSQIYDTTRTSVTAGLQRASSRLTAHILDGPTQILLRPLHDKRKSLQRREELQKLVTDVGELAFLLWTQRTVITCATLVKPLAFSVSSPSMTAHRLHHLDEDDEQLDGHEVVLMTQPLGLAWGDENGENYDQNKIWAKATVCVAEMRA
ncbi:uncharacterized protein BJX67DRAFT_373643 [Aspergillus lucknowensis]|uniref:Uncharacterized protein n=1 Tax=Aspergillus lucknowensis TaxID=176173 RepID=A0ABR4LJW9_9EURO